jgi:hypothetical protein
LNRGPHPRSLSVLDDFPRYILTRKLSLHDDGIDVIGQENRFVARLPFDFDQYATEVLHSSYN